jgi:hypothetical protein
MDLIELYVSNNEKITNVSSIKKLDVEQMWN